jgi:Fic family protein
MGGQPVDVQRFSASPVGALLPISGYDALLGTYYNHFAFSPNPLPRTIRLSGRTYKLVSEADREVGRLDAGAGRLPKPEILVRPTLYREAVSTSALEGTYAPLVEVFEADYVDERERRMEVREILNYVHAATQGRELIKSKPICVTLIAELQQLLVRGTRGDHADSGRLRQGQVFIGERTSGIEQSRYVPPPAGDILVNGMSDWEKWINADDDVPLLVKAALGHYQFEALHPFSDGNGRLGRLIVVLQLVYEGALALPILNLSPWLDQRKEEYKDRLLDVSVTGDYDAWVQFFAQAVKAQAEDALNRVDQIIQIREEMLASLKARGARGVVLDIVDDLISYPVITPTQAAELHNVTYPPANRAIQRLVDIGYLQEMTGRTYGRVYACRAIMRVLDSPPGALGTRRPMSAASYT